MRLVVEASVALKWFLNRSDERNVAEAAAVGEAIHTRGFQLFAPPHWTSEIIAVLARKEPAVVDDALILLDELNPFIVGDVHVFRMAADLAGSLDHHMFDTLYHAVALQTGAILITADEIYFRKAQGLQSIARLADFKI